MIFFKNMLITDAIASVLKAIIKGIYKVLKVLNLRLLGLLAIVGVILFFADAFKNKTVLLIYVAVVVVCLGTTVAYKIKKITSIGKKNRKGVQIMCCDNAQKNGTQYQVGAQNQFGAQYQAGGQYQAAANNAGAENTAAAKPELYVGQAYARFESGTNGTGGMGNMNGTGGIQKSADITDMAAANYPKYYKVKNSGCIMAEFEDRYELYVKTYNGLKRIRVDYKR